MFYLIFIKKIDFNNDQCHVCSFKFLAFLYLIFNIILIYLFWKNRRSFEIMKLTFKLEHLISQAPLGMKFSMTPAQQVTFNTLAAEKDALTAESYNLMIVDRDIWTIYTLGTFLFDGLICFLYSLCLSSHLINKAGRYFSFTKNFIHRQAYFSFRIYMYL